MPVAPSSAAAAAATSSCLGLVLAAPTSRRLPLARAAVQVTGTMTVSSSIASKKDENTTAAGRVGRREMAAAAALTAAVLSLPAAALAASDEEYVKDTNEVIQKVRTTINMDKTDPNVATAVAELRDASNTWVAKYRREKALLGRASFRDMYSALNAVSGHYISFGPTAPIPAKRKARILEEMDTAEKALLRGR